MSRLPAVLSVAVLTAVAAVSPPAVADDASGLRGYGFTVYAGSRFGGEFEDEATGEPVKLRDDDSFAATLSSSARPRASIPSSLVSRMRMRPAMAENERGRQS